MSKNYNFSREIDRCNTNSVKWDLREKFFPNSKVTPLWVADADWPAAPEIIEAMQKRIEHGIFGYSYPGQEVKNAICAWYKNQYNWEINSEWITIINGVVPGLNVVIDKLISDGEGVIIQPPVYYPFFKVIKKNNNKILANTLKLNNNEQYIMDFASLHNIIKKDNTNPEALILCSPHNPVGRVWNQDELQKLASICVNNDILLISDEIHGDFIYDDNAHTPLAAIDEELAENIITFNAPTKTFNLAGLKIAYSIIPNSDLREKFKEVGEKKILGSNIIAYEALKSAYYEGANWLNQQLDYLTDNLQMVKEIISELPDIKVIEPEGTYLVWLDFRKVNMSRQKLKDILFEKAEIGLEPGEWFGEAGKGFYRLNIATPRSRLRKALIKFKDVWLEEI